MSLLSASDLVVRPVSVAKEDLVYLRHILEASEGLGFIIAEKGGNILLVSSVSMEAELEQFISDLSCELTISSGLSEAHAGVFNVVG
jgi:hypothetical protein